MKRTILTRPVRTGPVYTKSGKTTPLPPPLREGRGGGVPPDRGLVEEKKSVDDLLDQASKLSAAERKELLAKLALGVNQTRTSNPRDLDMWIEAVYTGLAASNGAGDGAGVGPAAVKRILGSPACWGPVADFMAASKLDDLKVAERQSVYYLLAGLVIKHAAYVSRQSGAPMSAKLVGSCSTNITGLFDQAFPGYLGAGMAKIVARRLTQPQEA